jgi:hypothetical protein
MHRPLPEGSVIKRAAVAHRRIGPRDEWSVTVTIEMDDSLRPAVDASAPMVALDLGWRQLPDGMRIAATFDGTNEEMLVLPTSVLSQMRKADDLRSIRDKNFDAARAALVTALDGMKTARELPAWFAAATSHVSAWKSPGRLAALAQRWRQARFEGDAEAYDALEAWRYHDYHLWEWESSQRVKALRHRREIYRVFAAGLAKRYSRLIVEDFDLREVARHEEVDSAKAEIAGARSNRQLVAPSELRLALINAFDGRWEKVPAHGTTFLCHACGAANDWDQAKEIERKCSACGVLWDQDANAARNIFARASGGDGSGNAGPARDGEKVSDSKPVQESRWVRAKRMRADRDAASEAARKALSDAAE